MDRTPTEWFAVADNMRKELEIFKEEILESNRVGGCKEEIECATSVTEEHGPRREAVS